MYTSSSSSSSGPIVVAGATGYLGRHLIRALQAREQAFRALARSPLKLQDLNLSPDQLVAAEVTQADSLRGCLDGASVLISTVGITRQKDGLTYQDVDYQANINLLREAQRAGVKHMIYVAALGGEQMRHLKILAAKEAFVDALKASGLAYTIIRPNGFFSDMRDFLDMAKGGRVYLFGTGQFRLNPIHGADLAAFILDRLDQRHTELPVGGPDVFSQVELATLALEAHQKAIRITHLPDWTRRATIWAARTFTSVQTYGPLEFFLSMMAQDLVAPRYGSHHIADFFAQEAQRA
ncbi:MAG: SDR family oxidoreductase [Bacteroidetes bacterium]|nr:MAG: SDR family oxidoreductase [Bacteroidota bacterium]